MSVEIIWIGHASFRLATKDCVVYIDPWKLTEDFHDADVVFVSHDHYDHCSPSDVAMISSEKTAVFAPAGTTAQLSVARDIAPGQTVTVGAVSLQATAAYNVGKAFHPAENQWCGAVITLDSKRIYYAGDTDRIPEMDELRDIDLALLPVGGTYTLTAAEAAEVCRIIGCAAAVPYHWGDIVGEARDAETFAAKAPCPVTILTPGEKMTI